MSQHHFHGHHQGRRRPDAMTRGIAQLVFLSRWLQAPLYIGLILAQAYYVYRFFHEIAEIFHHPTMDESAAVLLILGLIDVVMISNLLIMVIIGGYETFVSRLRVEGHPDCPEWLSHVNANTMKVKLAMALIGISSIHLLKTFVNSEHHLNEKAVLWQCVIHTLFIVSAVMLGYLNRLLETPAHGPAHGPAHAHAPAHGHAAGVLQPAE
ncbi:TIGR00645 family protein [Azospirillum sp.]|uniref:TIGR00645 family protein n=1 Tax=Azospirillum sp. TaxID=34012 RepID=UPI002D3DB66E|nr:TIGR00645 family protein [Azospirillum sp.]HYD69933.1 TIGR00645 family protein [Azospirillum sp.]